MVVSMRAVVSGHPEYPFHGLLCLELSHLRSHLTFHSLRLWRHCKEENKILDKMHRQKVVEVEKLTQSVCQLEEAVFAGGAAANAVCDYPRKVEEINEEKRVLDRELAHAKVFA